LGFCTGLLKNMVTAIDEPGVSQIRTSFAKVQKIQLSELPAQTSHSQPASQPRMLSNGEQISFDPLTLLIQLKKFTGPDLNDF
jgi:hypothetical protein